MRAKQMTRNCISHARIAGYLALCGLAFSAAGADAQSSKEATTRIALPARIPGECLKAASDRYQLRPDVLLAIFKVESGGKAGVVGVNKNNSKDLGIGQLNDRSWAKYMVEKYGIPLTTLRNDACQGIMSSAYALRSEMNRCLKGGFAGTDAVWCSVAVYHHGGALPVPSASPTIREIQKTYVRKVWAAYQRMVSTGRFE